MAEEQGRGWTVRKAGPEEARQAAELMVMTAEGLYAYLYGGTRERAVDAVSGMAAEPENECSLEYVWMAEIDGRPAGLLQMYERGEAKAMRRGTGRAALRVLGLRRAAALGWRARPLDRVILPVEEGMLFVAHVALLRVSPRGGGGAGLLGFAEAEARRRGLSRLALDVETHNGRARRVYERFGFSPVREIRNRRLNRAFGFEGMERMEKALGAAVYGEGAEADG